MSPASTEPAAPHKVTLPVEGMTCAACQANVQRALAAAPGVRKAAVNLMMHEATVHYDPASTDPEKLVAAINETGYVSHLPSPASAVSDDEAREQAQAREYATLRFKSIVSLVLGAIAMIVSMPLMGGGVHPSTSLGAGGAHSSDPLIAWTMRVLDPPVRAAAPWLYAIEPRTLDARIARRHPGGDGMGGPPFLRSRVEGAAASQCGHEHADRHRHRGGLRVFGDRHVRARSVRCGRRPNGCLLRSGHHHHRAGVAGQRHGGARQDHHHSSADDNSPGCSPRPPACGGTGAKSTCRSRQCVRAMSSSSGQASGFRSTASSPRAPARWTSRCSPASRCRWRNSRAIA